MSEEQPPPKATSFRPYKFVIPLATRLARRLRTEPDGCIVWIGALWNNGYGLIVADGLSYRRLMTHRVAYELAKGPIPDGLQIDHLCRNRRCCNPDHLEAVTQAENNRRGNSISALNARKTHCKRGHEFNLENTNVSPEGARKCRVCRRQRQREWDARRKLACEVVS